MLLRLLRIILVLLVLSLGDAFAALLSEDSTRITALAPPSSSAKMKHIAILAAKEDKDHTLQFSTAVADGAPVNGVAVYPSSLKDIQAIPEIAKLNPGITDIFFIDPVYRKKREVLDEMDPAFLKLGAEIMGRSRIPGTLDWVLIPFRHEGKVKRLHLIGAEWNDFSLPEGFGSSRVFIVKKPAGLLQTDDNLPAFYSRILRQMGRGDYLQLYLARSPLTFLGWGTLGLELVEAERWGLKQGRLDRWNNGYAVDGWVVLQKEKDIPREDIEEWIRLDTALYHVNTALRGHTGTRLKDVPWHEGAFSRLDNLLQTFSDGKRADMLRRVLEAADLIVPGKPLLPEVAAKFRKGFAQDLSVEFPPRPILTGSVRGNYVVVELGGENVLDPQVLIPASILVTPQAVLVESLYLAPVYRRLGLGREILQKIREEFPGKPVIPMEVDKSDLNSTAFWKKMREEGAVADIFYKNDVDGWRRLQNAFHASA